MSSTRRILLSLSLGAIALLFAACGPTYPKCENDGHCADKGEFCLTGKCAQCRESSHCKGKGMQCSSGTCERIPGYCDEGVACTGKQKCRDNRCGNECLADNECGDTEFCDNGSCLARPDCGENALTAACPADKECVSGICQIRITKCGGDPVYFDYNKAKIKRGQRDKLASVAECLKGENVATLTVEGHCDERGTEEYNMALGERRATAAKKYLERKGAPAAKLGTMSYGKERPAASGSNETAWRKNRRAEFSSK